jgi:hypothetical protein
LYNGGDNGRNNGIELRVVVGVVGVAVVIQESERDEHSPRVLPALERSSQSTRNNLSNTRIARAQQRTRRRDKTTGSSPLCANHMNGIGKSMTYNGGGM